MTGRVKYFPPLLLTAACLLCSCAGPGRSGAGGDGSTAVVFRKQTFKLVKTPDPELEAALEGVLSSSYEAAVKSTGDAYENTGFTYSMTPKGAAYPLSEIEVSCIMREKYAKSSGQELCGEFFRELGARVKRAVDARQ